MSAVIGSTVVLAPTREWISDAAEAKNEERRPRTMRLLAPTRAIDFAIERPILIPPPVRTTVLPARERGGLVGVMEMYEVEMGIGPFCLVKVKLVWNFGGACWYD